MLLTKLHIPPAGNNIIHRSELHEKLNIGLSRKLILVSAPAGFGKTTVVSDWINQNKIHTAWFSLDNGDNDPVEFLNYIISGIQNIEGIGIIKLISYLLEHLPGNIHIVIITRSDPTIPIARLRSQHQLVEIRSSDLSFSANDIWMMSGIGTDTITCSPTY